MRLQFSPHYETPHAATASTRANPSREGRFADTRGTPLVRRMYRVLCRVAPAVAAHLAYRQLATPPRAPEGVWPVPLRGRTHTRHLVGGAGTIAVYEWGQGPAVLLVHGWGGNATHMGRLVQPLLNAGFRVLAFDAPAHGNSSGRTTDMVEFAAAVSTVARHAGPLHAVIGHSFGAAMAMYAMRDWGMTASRVVLASSFQHCNWFVRLFAEQVGLTPEVLRRVHDTFFQRYSGRFDLDRMSVVEMARQAHLPTLLVHDETDPEIPFEHSLALAAALPLAQFKATHGLGHHRVVRNPEVIRRIVAFLAEQG